MREDTTAEPCFSIGKGPVCTRRWLKPGPVIVFLVGHPREVWGMVVLRNSSARDGCHVLLLGQSCPTASRIDRVWDNQNTESKDGRKEKKMRKMVNLALEMR